MKLLKKLFKLLSQLLTQPKQNNSSPNTDSNQKPDQSAKPTNPIAEELAPSPYQVAKSQIGVNEKSHAELIRRYHAAAGMKAGPEMSWCSAFLIWCFKQANYKLPPSVNAWAPTWKSFGKPVDIADAKRGDIIGVDSIGPSGTHVGIIDYVHTDAREVVIISGNDHNCVKFSTRSFASIHFVRTYETH